MRVADLISVLNDDRRVRIHRYGMNFLVKDYDNILSVEFRFADEKVLGVDFNAGTGDYEIYID